MCFNRTRLHVSVVHVAVTMLQHIPLDGSAVVTCSVADPHIVLLTEDGHVLLVMFKVDPLGTGARLTLFRPNDSQVMISQSTCWLHI